MPSLKTRSLDKIRSIFTLPATESVLLRIVSGSPYGGLLSRLIPGPHLYEFGSKRRVKRDEISFELDLSCLMQWYVFWGLTETQRTRLYSLVKRSDVIFDVGTNIGETLLHFAKFTGEDGFVYGFEPDEHNFENARRNISLNSFKNIHVFNVGASDKKGSVKLFRVDPHNLGMNRVLSEEEAAKFDDFTLIETDTIDNIVEENNIDRIDLIKIDIEGYEMHALRGAAQTLERLKPKLFIEVGYTRLLKNGTSPTEMVVFLQKLGYSIFHAETDDLIGPNHDFSPLGDGGIDVYAIADKETKDQ